MAASGGNGDGTTGELARQDSLRTATGQDFTQPLISTNFGPPGSPTKTLLSRNPETATPAAESAAATKKLIEQCRALFAGAAPAWWLDCRRCCCPFPTAGSVDSDGGVADARCRSCLFCCLYGCLVLRESAVLDKGAPLSAGCSGDRAVLQTAEPAWLRCRAALYYNYN